jgi:DME family drug/metabolite transporter
VSNLWALPRFVFRRTPSSVARFLESRRGLLSVSAAAALWGTTGVIAQHLHARFGLSVLAISFYRLAVAAVVLAPVLIRTSRLQWRSILDHRVGVGVSGVGLGVYQALYYLAVTWVGVSVATLVSLGLAPVALIVVAAARDRRRPSPSTLAIAGFALVGLGLVSLFPAHSHNSAPHPTLGVLAAVGSGLGYAAATLVTQHLSRHTSALGLTALTSTIGAVSLLPCALFIGSGLTFAAEPESLLQLGFIGAGATALAYALFYAGLRTTPSEISSVLTLIEPLTATALAVLLLSEPMSGAGIVGSVLLLAAVAGLYLRPAAPTVELGV